MMMKKMMNTKVILIVTIIMMMCLLTTCAYSERDTTNALYLNEQCVVVDVEDGCIVVVEDMCGEVWCYEAEGDVPAIGTVVDMCMYNNNTPNTIYDDVIVDVVVH